MLNKHVLSEAMKKGQAKPYGLGLLPAFICASIFLAIKQQIQGFWDFLNFIYLLKQIFLFEGLQLCQLQFYAVTLNQILAEKCKIHSQSQQKKKKKKVPPPLLPVCPWASFNPILPAPQFQSCPNLANSLGLHPKASIPKNLTPGSLEM